MRKCRIKIVGKRVIHSTNKNRDFLFVYWLEPSTNPDEGYAAYASVVDQATYDRVMIDTEIDAITSHNGTYHSFIAA